MWNLYRKSFKRWEVCKNRKRAVEFKCVRVAANDRQRTPKIPIKNTLKSNGKIYNK